MNKFIITTDSACDFSRKELEAMGVNAIPFNYSERENIHVDTMEVNDYKKFYKNMREGTIWKTSQINPQEYTEFFQPLLEKDLPILHISLGSGLSNTINSAYIAQGLIKESNPKADIRFIDSKIASLGEGWLVNEACKLRDQEMDINEAYAKLQSLVPNVNTYFTTDTLTYFARGGRLSKTVAVFANALKVNPILDCNPAGNLRMTDKCRGANKAISRIVNRINETVINPQDQTVFICHADDEEKGNMFGKLLVEQCGFKDYLLTFMGPIIGAHTGPGLIAIFYYGIPRKEIVSLPECEK